LPLAAADKVKCEKLADKELKFTCKTEDGLTFADGTATSLEVKVAKDDSKFDISKDDMPKLEVKVKALGDSPSEEAQKKFAAQEKGVLRWKAAFPGNAAKELGDQKICEKHDEKTPHIDFNLEVPAAGTDDAAIKVTCEGEGHGSGAKGTGDGKDGESNTTMIIIIVVSVVVVAGGIAAYFLLANKGGDEGEGEDEEEEEEGEGEEE
jgi:hypothetical protein